MRTNFTLAIMSLLVICSQAIAQIEALQIEGPHEAKPGTLVRLSANTVAEETPFWIVLEPIELDYEQVQDGNVCCFQREPSLANGSLLFYWLNRFETEEL